MKGGYVYLTGVDDAELRSGDMGMEGKRFSGEDRREVLEMHVGGGVANTRIRD